jgi:acyl-CoA thioesterase
MDKLKEIFKHDKFAASCGIEIVEFRPGYAKCTMPVTETHLNAIGTVMGGAIFTLADYTFSVAANSHGTLAVTLNAFISYMQACKEGPVTAVAIETSRTKRTGVYQVSVTDGTGRLISSVTGTCYFKTKSAP